MYSFSACQEMEREDRGGRERSGLLSCIYVIDTANSDSLRDSSSSASAPSLASLPSSNPTPPLLPRTHISTHFICYRRLNIRKGEESIRHAIGNRVFLDTSEFGSKDLYRFRDVDRESVLRVVLQIGRASFRRFVLTMEDSSLDSFCRRHVPRTPKTSMVVVRAEGPWAGFSH